LKRVLHTAFLGGEGGEVKENEASTVLLTAFRRKISPAFMRLFLFGHLSGLFASAWKNESIFRKVILSHESSVRRFVILSPLCWNYCAQLARTLLLRTEWAAAQHELFNSMLHFLFSSHQNNTGTADGN